MLLVPVLVNASLVITTLLLIFAPTHAQMWTVEPVWSDEFNEIDGSGPNTNNWAYDVGGNGWGNNELQYYTDRRENSYVQGGFLVIEARKERYSGKRYTSARLRTQNLVQFKYGRVEARLRLPLVQGAWPAFWMLGSNFPQVGWPNCGEIDIMEWVYSLGSATSGAAHGPGYSGGNAVSGHWNGPVTDAFHVYAIEWEPNEIRYYVDGSQYFAFTPVNLPSPWVFDHDFFIVLNVAIGGNFGGTVGGTVQFPIHMTVDYVRVYGYQETPSTPTPTPPPTTTPPPSPPPTPPSNSGGKLVVANITMYRIVQRADWKASATVTVTNGNSEPIAGVSVHGSWSGLVNTGESQKNTDANGQVTMNSAKTRKTGSITFCVRDLVLAGYTYTTNIFEDCGTIAP